MNLTNVQVVLRPRSLADGLDLALLFLVGHWRRLGKLAALVLGPCFLLCVGARWVCAAPWPVVWGLALVSASLAQGPFTRLAGDLLFGASRSAPASAGGRVRAGLRYLVGHTGARLAIAAASPTAVLAAVVGERLLFVDEVVLLEQASVRRAFLRSVQLVRRQHLGCFGLWLTLVAAPWAGAAGAEVLGQTTVHYVLQLGEPFGRLFEDGGSVYALLGFFASVPFIAVARFLKYIDIRTRKEGWDIQVRFLVIARAAQDLSKDRPQNETADRTKDQPTTTEPHAA